MALAFSRDAAAMAFAVLCYVGLVNFVAAQEAP